ncbi:MAG: hypothetical protein LBD35_00525, partial [Prevotellaceae bacterium]|nr:hypothetical protein [Prevotellaceae bacterium]
PFLIPKRTVFEAWEEVKRNHGAAGIDGVSIKEYEQNLGANFRTPVVSQTGLSHFFAKLLLEMTCGRRGEQRSVREVEKIAGQARNDRPAAGSVPAVHSSIRPFVHSSVFCRLARLLNAPSGRTVNEGCGSSPQDPQSFQSPELSALFLRQYHFAICFS